MSGEGPSLADQLSEEVMAMVTELLVDIALEEPSGAPTALSCPGEPLPTAAEWAAEQNARGVLCACGCGGRVMVLPRHRSTGAPRFVHGHHRRKNRPTVQADR